MSVKWGRHNSVLPTAAVKLVSALLILIYDIMFDNMALSSTSILCYFDVLLVLYFPKDHPSLSFSLSAVGGHASMVRGSMSC